MRCPFCGYEDTKVIDSRPMDAKKRRRRECTKCGKRFTTFETVERPLLMVLKKDGTFEPFDRSKLIRGIFNAIKKRPVNIEQVNTIVDDIENYYANAMLNQATTEEIGNMILDHLKKIDDVAYIRFASVYKDFTDVDSFIKAISELGDK
ncbi:transcriptional regulator NrdR [Porcipelethomonas sp.]|uniref:transcriptional regulator NrdR n=1 Tax=Porcipelethomonas sp. TaxID=2981675 RepID=UPI003EF57ACD